VGASFSNGLRCPSVCHTRISPKQSGIEIRLLENSNRKPGFPIQNLPSDLRSEVWFRHFGCFRVGNFALRPFWQKWCTWPMDYGSVGTVTSRHHTGYRGGHQLSSSPITDNALFVFFDFRKVYLWCFILKRMRCQWKTWNIVLLTFVCYAPQLYNVAVALFSVFFVAFVLSP